MHAFGQDWQSLPFGEPSCKKGASAALHFPIFLHPSSQQQEQATGASNGSKQREQATGASNREKERMEDDEDVIDEQDAPVFSGLSPRSIHLVDAALAQTRTRIVAPDARTITMTTTTMATSTTTATSAVVMTTSASATSEMDEDAEAMEQQSLLREEQPDQQQQQRRAPSQQNRVERNSSSGDGASASSGSPLNRVTNELDWDVEEDGWMPKPARLHSGKTRSCAVCFAPLQYTTMQGWDDYLQSEEYLLRLQDNLLDDTFISGLICGDSTGGDLPTEHRMHKNRKMKCRQSVHDYLNMVSAGVVDKSGKEKASVRTLEEMLLNVLPTPVLTHVIERRLAVISHSSRIACKLLKENRVEKVVRPVDTSGSNVELHHLAIHTLSALLSSFDYNSQHAPQSFEEMSRLLTCFPVLSLYSFWSPKKKSPERPLVLKNDMVEATSCSGNPRPHPAAFAVDDADSTFWLSQQRPGLTHFVIRHPDVSRISSIQIRWHLKCFPQRVAIEYRAPGSDKFVQLAEEKTTAVQPPEYFSVRFPGSCAEMRIAMSGIPPANRNGTYAIENIRLNVPCSNSLFVEPKSALNDVANWLLGAVQHRNEDVIIKAIGALKAWALSTASLSTTLLFVKMLLDFGKRCSFSADPGVSRFAIQQGYKLYEGIKAYKSDESEKMLRGEGKKKNSESRKIRALFESSVCSAGVTIEDAGLTVRTRETSYQYAAVNTGISSGKASWKFRLDNDTVDDEMTCFGAAILPVTVSGYDSSPNLWMLRGYNGNLYARGHKLSRSIGKVHPGDIIQIEVDMTEGTMAYKINDTEYGVVFTDLAGHEVYPAVSFYGSGKVITLLGVQKWDDSDSGAADVDPVYLSNIKEYHYSVGYGTFGKGNQLGYASDSDARALPAATTAASHPVTISGEPRQRCLSTHPPSRGNSYVIYDLADAYNRLAGAVGINDDAQNEVLQQCGVSVVFSILGDGKALWRSKPTSEARQVEKFDISVEGVRMLEMIVTCSGSNHCAHAIWIDPCVYPLDEWMCTECTFTNKGAHKSCTVCRLGMRCTSLTDSTAPTQIALSNPVAHEASSLASHDDAQYLEQLMKSRDPFLELGSVITSELYELSCLSSKREKLKHGDDTARRVPDLHGRGNQRSTVGFEEPFFRQPCGSAFTLLLDMLRRFQIDFVCQDVSESSSEAEKHMFHHSKHMCIHTLGIISSNFESIAVYEVGDLKTEIGVTEGLVNELRCELERMANIHDQGESQVPEEVQLAASETIISGVSVVYSSSSDKLQLLLRLLRSHAVEAFHPGTSRFVLLSEMMRVLASPGKEGILNLFPFLMTTSSGESLGVEEASLQDVNETVRLLIHVIQQSEWKHAPSDNSSSDNGVSIAKEALSLLKTYQLCLLAEAVGLTKKKRSGGSVRESSSALDSSELNMKRSLVQESTIQYGFLLLRASRETIESLLSEQTENSFVLSPEACSIQASIRTCEIPVLSELLPWFVSCLCLLRRQTWLARPVLPALCRLLGSFDQYCSELQIVNKSDTRLRKLELHQEARMIEAHEMERMIAVDKSLVVNHQASKQMYNVFKQLYTGDKDHFEGQIGFQFEATSTFLIVALGRSVNPAKNSGRLIRYHTVRLWEEASQLLIAQVTVTGASKKDLLGYALESLVTPVKLTQGKLYRLTTQEFANGGDPWYKKENLPDEEYDSSYIKILRDCYASGSTGFPNSQNLSGAAYGVPTFLVEGENPVASIPRFASPFGSLSLKFNVKKKLQSVCVSHSGTSVYGVGGGATWRSCYLQTAFVQGVHSVDFIVKSARAGGTVSGQICVGVDWSMCSKTQAWSHPSSRFESFFGETLSSIGWMPSIGALWVKGKRSSYGKRFALVSGDILTVVVDYDLHTLSFAHNGKSVGIAVGLAELHPASSALPHLPDALTPGVSIYGSQDVVQVRPSGIAKSTLRVHWLFDLHNSLSSLAGRIASTLIAGHPVNGIEEELLPWLQSPLLSGGILGDTFTGHRDQRDSGQLDWQKSLEMEFSQSASNPAFRSVLLASDSGSAIPAKRASGSSTMFNAELSAIRQSKFFESLSQDMSDAGSAHIILSWLEKRSPDRSFLSRLGKFPKCERLMCAVLIKHAPPHVLHEVQAIVSGADPTRAEVVDHSNLDPSEDLLLVWKRVVTLRHWLIKSRQDYRARSSDEIAVESIETEGEAEVPPQNDDDDDDDGNDSFNFEKRLVMPKTFDDFIEQVCQRAEFLCLLDPASEEREKLNVDSQVALSNLAEKWSAQKTPPSLQPMLERWKSLRESDSSKWSGIVDVLRAQDRWRSRRASITHPPGVPSSEKVEVPKSSLKALDEQDEEANPKRRYHYKDSFSATMKACDLYIRNGVGAPPEVLRMLLERRQKRSDSRLFGLQAMRSILSILSFDTARHNAIIFLRPALRGFTDDEKESRELNDGQVVTESFRATVRHHYLKGLEGCNRPTIERVQQAFCELYSFLAQLLSSNAGGGSADSQFKHAILCAWCLDFEPRDHPFLLKTGILSTVHDMFSIQSSQVDAAADLAGMKMTAKTYFDHSAARRSTMQYTAINWHPLSEEFVQQSVLHTGYVTKRDILRLLLRAPSYACTKQWWKESGLDFALGEDDSPSMSSSRHTASSMALLYSELLKNLQTKLSWCGPQFLGQKALQFGMASSSAHGSPLGQNAKPAEISFVETPALGEVQDFCIEMWVFPVELTGYRSLRSDNGFQDGSVYLEFVDHHLQLGISGNFPREQVFSSYRFRAHEWSHIALSYDVRRKSLALVVNGTKVEERRYERVCDSVHFRAGRIGCWVSEVDAHGVTASSASIQRNYKGSIVEIRVWRVPRTVEQIRRDYQRSIPFEIEDVPRSHDQFSRDRASNLLALWHLSEGEGLCGHDSAPSLSREPNQSAADQAPLGNTASISSCHWGLMNLPVVSDPSVNAVGVSKWAKVLRGIIAFQRKTRSLAHEYYQSAVVSSRLVCQYEEDQSTQRWSDFSDESDDDEEDADHRIASSCGASTTLKDLGPAAQQLIKEWSVSTDQQILLKKQTKRCAWIVFRFLATIGVGGVIERREGEAKSVAAIAKMKRKQKLQKGDSISELGSPIHQRLSSMGKLDAGRAAGLSYDEEDQKARTIEAASDAAKSAATNRELEEPVLQTLWFSQEFHRKVFEVIERELVLGTTLIRDAEGLTRAQRMLRSISTPMKRKGEALRSHTSGIEGKGVGVHRPRQRLPSELSAQGELMETLEVEMYMFGLLSFMLSLSGSSPALHHLSKSTTLRELLDLLRTASPRSQRVVKLLLRRLCCGGVVTPANVSSLLGSESVFVDLLLDQVAESICSTAAPLSAHGVGAASSGDSSSAAPITESLSNPTGFRSGQIYLVLASESVALLRLLLKERSWQARVAELLCSAIRNVAPVLTRRKSDSSYSKNAEPSDIRVRAAIIRAVGALCVLGSHSDCLRIGGRVEVTAKESRPDQTHLDYGFNFSDSGAGPAPATLIELNSRTSTVRVVFDASSEEFDPGHNVQEVNLSSLSPVEEIRLPSDVIPLTMDMMPVILKLSSLEESSIMSSFDDLWRMQVRSRALLALEAILRHSMHMAKDVAHKHITKSLLKSALSPVCLNTFVSLPFLQERGRMILCRLIEASTPLGNAMFRGLGDPKSPTIADAKADAASSGGASGDADDPEEEESEEYRVRRGFASTLAAMGFEFDLCMAALEHSRNDPNLAVEWLMGVGAAAYQERQQTQRLASASLHAGQESAASEGGEGLTLEANARELESISGMPYCLAFCALELLNSDPNRAMEWLMENGSRYVEKADSLSLLSDEFVTEKALTLDDSAAMEDVDQPDPLVASSSISSAANSPGTVAASSSLLVSEVCDNSDIMAVTLAPILAPAAQRPATKKVKTVARDLSSSGFAPLDPEYLTPHVLLSVSSQVGPLPSLSASGRTGLYRRCAQDQGVLITFLNTETGAYEDEWHFPQDVRRITKIYDEEIQNVGSIHRVALRTENALATHYARSAVAALLSAGASGSSGLSSDAPLTQPNASFSDTILNAVGGPRQFVNLLKLVAASEMAFSRGRDASQVNSSATENKTRHRAKIGGKRLDRSVIREESGSILQSIQKITLEVLEEEARCGKVQHADWLWYGEPKPSHSARADLPKGGSADTSSELDAENLTRRMLLDEYGEIDEDLYRAIAMSVQESGAVSSASSTRRQSHMEETKEESEECDSVSLLPKHNMMLMRTRQPSYAEAQEVANEYLGGGVDDHDGLLSSVLVKECVSHFVESTRVAGEGLSNDKSAQDPRLATQEFHSLHPYFGRCEYTRAVAVDRSFRCIRVVFDHRCKLGAKAKLSFYSDAECEHRILLVDSTATASGKRIPDLVVHSHQFWFRFNAVEDDPIKNHGYGFRFQVKPMPSICWSKEEEVLVNPSLEWACWILEFLLNDATELVARGAVHNRKIYGALVRYLRSPGAPFKSRVVRLLLQLLHKPELFPASEKPDLEALESIGQLALARSKIEKDSGKPFISAHLLQLVELSMMTSSATTVFERSGSDSDSSNRTAIRAPLKLPTPADRRVASEMLNDVNELSNFLLGKSSILPQHILVAIWLDTYGSTGIIESPHPYSSQSKLTGKLNFAGAQSLLVTFDSRCATASDAAFLELSGSSNSSDDGGDRQSVTLKRYSGSRHWPSGAVDLSGDVLEYKFVGDENPDGLFGVSLSVTAVGLSKDKQLARASVGDIVALLDKLVVASQVTRGEGSEAGQAKSTVWSSAMDLQLVDWINTNVENASSATLSSVDLRPSDVRLHPTLDGLRCSLLLDLPTEVVQLRFSLLKYFNQALKECLPLLDLRDTTSSWTVAHRLRLLSHCVFFDIKNALVEAAIEATGLSGDAASNNTNTARITLDRLQALESRDDREVEPSVSECFFAQAFRQLNCVDPTLFRRKIDSKGRLFSVKFRGEEGVDWGGVYREGANSMVDDLFSAHFSLFVLCPNGQHDTGINRGMYLPNPKCTSPVAIQMYEFVGKLLGISLRTHGDFPFAFPSLVWKQLLHQPLDESDLEGTDAMFVQMLDGIRSCERDGILTEEEFDAAFEGLDLKFTAFDCNGQEAELVDGGKGMKVTFQNRVEYCRLAEQYRLYEGSLQVAAMARGFALIFPMRALTLLTWQEMEILTCGSPKIDIALWKQHTRYDGYNEGDETVALFWEAMESFSDEQRSDFVRFAWGRSRLPRGKWPQPFKLTKKGGRDSTLSLPVAHTCFFSVELPPYTTTEKMRSMLLATINFGLGGILMA